MSENGHEARKAGADHARGEGAVRPRPAGGTDVGGRARPGQDEPEALRSEAGAESLVNRTGDTDRESAGELGGLALEQAAAYMRATVTGLANHLPLFRARQAELLARGEAGRAP